MRKLLYIILALSIFSCREKEIDFDGADAKAAIAVSAFFSTEEIVEVEITSTMSVIGKQSNKTIIDNASVSLYDADNLIEALTYNISKKKYVGTIKPLASKTYTLKASVPNFDDVATSITIPKKVSITNVVVSEYRASSADNNSYMDRKASVSFTIPKVNAINYYMIVLKSEGIDFLGDRIVSEEPIKLSSKDAVLVGSKSGDTGFGDSEYKNKFNLFTDELISGNTYTLDVLFASYQLNGVNKLNDAGVMESKYYIDKELVVNIYSISEDYYKFLKSYENQLDSGDDIFTEPYQLWSNVTGGTGIGAGFTIDSKNVHFGLYGLLDGMSIDNKMVDINSLPIRYSTTASSAELFLGPWSYFNILVFKDEVLVNNRGIDHFSGTLEGLVLGENKYTIFIQSKSNPFIVYLYELIVTRI